MTVALFTIDCSSYLRISAGLLKRSHTLWRHTRPKGDSRPAAFAAIAVTVFFVCLVWGETRCPNVWG